MGWAWTVRPCVWVEYRAVLFCELLVLRHASFTPHIPRLQTTGFCCVHLDPASPKCLVILYVLCVLILVLGLRKGTRVFQVLGMIQGEF